MPLISPRLHRLWRYMRPYWRLNLLAFFATAVPAVLQLALPAGIQYSLDSLIPKIAERASDPENWKLAAYFAVVMGANYLAVGFISLARDYFAAKIGGNIIADIRSELFMRLERVSFKFYQNHQIGEVMSRLMSDVSRIQDLFTTTLLSSLTNVLFGVSILIYLLWLNWSLALVGLIPLPLTIYLSRKYGFKINTISRTLQESVAELSARVQEKLVGLKTVKAFGREADEAAHLDTVLDRLKGIYVKHSVNASLARNFVQILSFVGVIVYLSIGIYFVATGKMTPGQLMAFFILLNWFNMPVQALASVNLEVQSSMASVDRVFQYLDEPIAIVEDPHPVSISTARGVVSLEKVGFAYNAEGFQIKDLNLSIAAGEKLAIVGPSGCGKSTIVNLIMRFYDPQKGTVMLDGIDLRKLSFKSLRESISIVDQEPMLFNMSIKENIAYSKADAAVAEVEAAARIANIHDFITKLPNGYDTMVGERGMTMSGGEKQRMCLARAVLKNPAVLILDEATSALDSISEQLIQEALDRILVNKTAIIVAHRLSTVQRADRIITMKDGAIIDQGTHTELMSRSAIYRELAERQLVRI